ncbi:MAG TPA: type II secretion system ATPase GspE [Candidatus Limnocylindrales bacterium]|nr:type II secretion system ATPase GspE [Candidatus Limnocylindrales bacterium]
MSEPVLHPLDRALARAGIDAALVATARRKAGADGEFAAQLEAVAGVASTRLAEIQAEALGLSVAESIDLAAIAPDVLARVSMQQCRRGRMLPVALEAGRLVVATSDPFRVGPLDDLRVLYGVEIDPVVVPEPALLDAVNRAFDFAAGAAADVVDDLRGTGSLADTAAELSEAPDLLEAEDAAPIIRLVNSLIFQAAKDGASDIHIEPFERVSSIRFRIDGIMSEVLAPPRRLHAAIVSRIKVMARMNIAEKRLPQDGGIRTRVAGREVDIRVSTVPTAFGERVVLRLLDRSATLLGLEESGIAGDNLTQLRRLIHQSHGIVLVTGPTGSGKTTTLYAALSEINSADKNIITIEDPIEYQLRGIGQIQVNPKIELSFASGLRSVLRQDPDVIMVGEIRDVETARIAIQAALTGHLVFSTLHTNDSFSAITRLLDMGIEPFLVSSSVIGIGAQRLVRRLCPQCSVPATPSDPTMIELGITTRLGSARMPGPGCDACRNSGYRGRLALSEMLVTDDALRAGIMERTDAATLQSRAVAQGMKTMRDDGAAKVRAGLTSASEVLRVTAEDAE